MEIYILSKEDLSILSICKLFHYEINLDEETNAKSIFTLIKTEGLKKDNFIVLNGLYKQFLFIIDEVQSEKGSNVSTVTALDISNMFDRKIIEKQTEMMTTDSIEKFIANMMSANFVNSDDVFLNVDYIDIYWNTSTQGMVATNAENGLYNFHTFLINCRQYKNIYTEFKFINGKLRIDINHKVENAKLIDTTLPEVTNYNKIYEDDITAKVTVLIREDGNEYNLYLKTDRTTTTNKNDANRAFGKIEVISVDTADKAAEEALNVMKGNNYKHLVEFKIAKTSKLMDITQLHIGRPIIIKTEDDIYNSYISAITLSDENFVYFKSGTLRDTLIDKLKKAKGEYGNKLDTTGGVIHGNVTINGVDTDNLLEYSMAEKKIGYWIDGKPLYKKTINFGALPNSTTKGVAHNIQNLKRVVKLEGFAGSSLHNGGITLPHSTDTNPIALYIDNTDVRVLTLIDDSVYTESYVYIYYTKTTD